jgi:hypothetical protein
MTKRNIQNFKSLENFKQQIEDTYALVNTLETQIIATKQLVDFTKAHEKPDYHKFEKLLNVTADQSSRMYELGFISLFANFECFMFEFLKDLFKKYPSSFRSEKTIKYEDIKDFEGTTEIKDYFIDSLAIDKSYDIDTWINFLSQRFGIKIFKKSKDLILLKALNSLRNIILHSGGKTNSKFRNDMRGFIKSPVPIGQDFTLDRKEYFIILYRTFKKIAQDLEGN